MPSTAKRVWSCLPNACVLRAKPHPFFFPASTHDKSVQYQCAFCKGPKPRIFTRKDNLKQHQIEKHADMLEVADPVSSTYTLVAGARHERTVHMKKVRCAFSTEIYARGCHWFLKASRRVTNCIPLGCPIILPVGTVISVQILKVHQCTEKECKMEFLNKDNLAQHGARFSTGIYTRGCHWFLTPARLKLLQACDQ